MFLVVAAGFLRAENMTFPAGLEVGKNIYSLPHQPTPLDQAGWWTAGNGAQVQLTEGGLSINSGEANPLLQLQRKLGGDILVCLKISFDPKRNHYFRVSLFNRFAVEYNSQYKRFTLAEKSDPADPTANDYTVLEEVKGDLGSFVGDPEDFTLFIAVADSNVVVWGDSAQLFSHAVDGTKFQGGLTIQSGWQSEWTIKELEIYELKGGI